MNALIPANNTPAALDHATPASSIAANLERHAHGARGSFASATERAWKADSLVFSAWCFQAGLDPLPAAPDTVARFVDAMGEVKAPATVRRYLASIAHQHKAAKLASPTQEDAVTNALKRLNRAKGTAQKQASGLNRPLVDRMLAAAPHTLLGARNRALLAVAYDTLCRRSELAGLQVADLVAAADGSATVTIHRSKTDQEGQGTVRYLAADTMRHVTAWLTQADVTDGALFRAVNKGGRVGGAIDGGELPRLYKAMAAAAGVPASIVAGISGHSSRVGAAQDMVGLGIEMPAVMQAGGWRTPAMVARYTARIDARRSGAAKMAAMQDRS